MTELQRFPGFEDPAANYYRLPNTWFDIMRQLRESTDARIVSALKLLEYVLKHTWGYQRFDGHIRLSASEIRSGRRFKGKRLDSGTRLSQNSVRKATEILMQFGAIEVEQKEDKARRIRAYRPRLRQADEPPAAKLGEDFAGFDVPESNYFKVPNIWTDLMRLVQSAATILVVEYFCRHAWGYHNLQGVWLDPEQVAHGRKRVDGRRYDQGVGYDVTTVYRGLQEAAQLKLLVWAQEDELGSTKRLYNLRWKGMHVEEASRQYLGPVPWEPAGTIPQDHVPAEPPRPVMPAAMIRSLEGSPPDIANATCNLEEVICNLEEVAGNSEDVVRKPEEVICKPEARTARPHTLRDTDPTLCDTPATTSVSLPANRPLFAVVAGRNDFLRDLGIENPARRQILKSRLPLEAALAWALYAWCQETLDRNKPGFLIKRLLSAEDCHHPPEKFRAFAQLTLHDWCALWRLIEPYSRVALDDLPSHLQAIAPLWLLAYAAKGLEALPPGVREILEQHRRSEIGIEDEI